MTCRLWLFLAGLELEIARGHAACSGCFCFEASRGCKDLCCHLVLSSACVQHANHLWHFIYVYIVIYIYYISYIIYIYSHFHMVYECIQHLPWKSKVKLAQCNWTWTLCLLAFLWIGCVERSILFHEVGFVGQEHAGPLIHEKDLR